MNFFEILAAFQALATWMALLGGLHGRLERYQGYCEPSGLARALREMKKYGVLALVALGLIVPLLFVARSA